LNSYRATVSDIRFEHRHLDVACELNAAEAGARVARWRRLWDEAGLGSVPIPGGARLWLRPEAEDQARDLAGQEAACCGFLDIALAAGGDRLRLDVTSPAPGAGPVIACIAGLDPRWPGSCC
jgi:hypothetical protein